MIEMEERFEKEVFVIDTDLKAEWAILKIKEDRAEMERQVSVCTEMINSYKEKIELATKQYEYETSYLKSHLQQYFETVEHKKTKTQETYKLPSGTLKKKIYSPELVRDEEKLCEWLENNGSYRDYVKIKKVSEWALLKKWLNVSGTSVVCEDGTIVEGITVVERDAEFILDI